MTETPRRTVKLNADELDLAEQLALSIVLRENPTAVVRVHGGIPDMETTAELYNRGWAMAHAFANADDEATEDEVDEAAENNPAPILFEHDGKVVAAILLAPGYTTTAYDAIVVRHGDASIIVHRRAKP